MAGNPILLGRSCARGRGAARAPAAARNSLKQSNWNLHGVGSRVPREVVGGGGSGSADTSHSSLGGALAPPTAEMLLSRRLA